MRLLVTGGAGFIGSNFIRYALGKYPELKVVNLDKLTYAANTNNLKDIENNPNYSFIEGDICDSRIVGDCLKDCDVVINFAAETHVDRSIENSALFVRTNTLGTYTLLEAARRSDVETFVQISSDEVYGSIEDGAFSESDALNPSNPYSFSKAAADLLVESYYKTYDLPTIITRSSNNYGPYQHPEKLIPLFITNLIQDKTVPLYSNGDNIRDWLYVIDNCEAIDLIIKEGKIGEIYNIAGGCEKTNLEVTKEILRLLNKSVEYINHVEDRPFHDRRYSLDCAKIKALGWSPKTDFKKGLKSTVEWYKNNKWLWEVLKK